MSSNYKRFIEGDEEEFDADLHSDLIESEINNFKILHLSTPKTNLTSKEIELYFCHCGPGQRGEKHLSFCNSLNEDNEINGHPFVAYLSRRDYEKYAYLIGQSGDKKDEFLINIKTQIKNILNLKK